MSLTRQRQLSVVDDWHRRLQFVLIRHQVSLCSLYTGLSTLTDNFYDLKWRVWTPYDEFSIVIARGGMIASDPLQHWDYVGDVPHQHPLLSRTPSATRFNITGGGINKPPSMRSRPVFEEFFKTNGDMCRQFLRKALGNGPFPLEDQRRWYHGVIEAACSLRGRMFASHTEDARRAADQDLIQRTWDMLKHHDLLRPDTHMTQADSDQLQAFLVGTPEVRSVIGESRDFGMMTENSAPTSLTASFTDEQQDFFMTSTNMYPDQPAFSEFRSPLQVYPSPFVLRTTDQQYPSTAQIYRGPYQYTFASDTYQPELPAWLDNPPDASFAWPIDAPAHNVSALPTPLQTPPIENRVFDTDIAIEPHTQKLLSPLPPRPLKRSHKRSPLSRGTRQRRPPSTRKPITLAPDVFVDESAVAQAMAKSPRKRRKITATVKVDATGVRRMEMNMG